MRVLCYATATVSYNAYGGTSGTSEAYDSRNPANDADGTTGQGKISETIYSKIRPRGLRFDGRPCDAYNHADGLVYPVVRGTKRYHWFRDNPVSTSISGPHAAVYIKGSAPQLNVEVEPLNGSPVRVKATLDATTAFTSTGSPAKPPGYPRTVFKTLSASNATVAFPALPGSVNSYTVSLTLDFECQRSDGTWTSIYSSPVEAVSLKLYAIHAQPNFPMNTPWTGVLEDSCRFAAGKSTSDDVAKEETRGLYFSKRLLYPFSKDATFVDPNGTFQLSNFLNTSGYQQSNCVDVSDYLCICAAAQGLNFQVQAFTNADVNGNATDLRTNPVCLVGGDPLSTVRPGTGGAQYAVSEWGLHQFCLLAGNVYDSCAAQKFALDGTSYANPPIKWPLNSYWQSPLPVGGLPAGSEAWSHLGLVDCPLVSSGANPSSNPSSPLALTTTRQPSVR